MNHDTPIEIPEAPAAPRKRRGLLVGGALLAVATLGIAATTAGAQSSSDPAVDAPVAINVAEEGGLIEPADDLDDGFELDDSFELDDAAWKAFDDCITTELGDLARQFEELEMADPETLTDEDFDAIFTEENEQKFEAAEKACEVHLPQEIQDEIAAWAPFDECIDEQFATIEADLDGTLDDETGEDSLTDEQYEAIDQAFQAAEEACASLLPEGVTLDDLMDVNGEFCSDEDGEGHFDEDMDGGFDDEDVDDEMGDEDLDGEDVDEPVEEPAAG